MVGSWWDEFLFLIFHVASFRIGLSLSQVSPEEDFGKRIVLHLDFLHVDDYFHDDPPNVAGSGNQPVPSHAEPELLVLPRLAEVTG